VEGEYVALKVVVLPFNIKILLVLSVIPKKKGKGGKICLISVRVFSKSGKESHTASLRLALKSFF
jgi:hypothetical protein